jgi:predicted PurR-regulated permease PerM
MKSISIYRLNAILLLVILTTVIMWYGKEFLVPVAFSILLAMLLRPVANKLEEWGVGRVLSTFICILLILGFIAGMFAIIGAQASRFTEDLPSLQERALQALTSIQAWIKDTFGVAPQQQIEYLKSSAGNVSQSARALSKSVLSGMMGLATGSLLTILYFFFLMWKREKYLAFFLKLVDDKNRVEVHRQLGEITRVASQYLIGRLISMLFLAVFYIIGFSIVGLENGFLVALIAVLPTIVPYVGAFVGGFFPLAMALVSGSPGVFLPVLIILVVAQILDNNIIEPMVEGESLDISPIFTIVAIVLGELVWGVAGMILFIPMFAILKIVCEHVPALHPLGFLLSNEIEEPGWVRRIKGWFKKGKKEPENSDKDYKTGF